MTAPRFHVAARLLHWLMAVMIVAMLFVGIGMVSTVSAAHTWLLDLHRPLGILILALAVVRLAVRLTHRVPPLPGDLPRWQAAAARASHYGLYGLMFVLPLVGWAMLSAAGYPIVLWGSTHLPPIAPINPALYAALRQAHTVLALMLFLVVLIHVGAALFHAWVRRDGVFASMALWQVRRHREDGTRKQSA